MMPEVAYPRIEFLLLADRAEVTSGKLYMMGGCWDRVQLPGLEAGAMLGAGVAMRVLVALADTGTHTVTLSLTGPNEPTIIPNQFQFLRNPTVAADQPEPLAVLLASECYLGIKEAGVYRLRASIDGGAPIETQFSVVVPGAQAIAVVA
jgi:hypothetical protein